MQHENVALMMDVNERIWLGNLGNDGHSQSLVVGRNLYRKRNDRIFQMDNNHEFRKIV